MIVYYYALPAQKEGAGKYISKQLRIMAKPGL
jgi:hypothetical protein